MGTVYRAQHMVLERESAIKVLHPQLNSDPTFVERFMREARAMARLDHENIIRIYDVFQDDKVHLIAMELFNGVSLKTLIEKETHLPLSQVISIILQCARGLAYAHAQGIVHRDIKPSNIMINAQGHIKITDFGIAAALDDAAAALTTTGQLVGTPRYMSPEQARNEPVDRRSDIYALGMVAYELLTGKTPFEGDSGVAIIGKLAYETQELPLQFPERVPEEMRQIVSKMLARNADDRYSHATHLMQALKAVSELYQDKEDSTTMVMSEGALKRNYELEPKYVDNRFADPTHTSVINKSPPSQLHSSNHQAAKKPWIKSRVGGMTAALSIVAGIAIGTVMVLVNPQLDFHISQAGDEKVELSETMRAFNQLLELEKQMQEQKLKAKDWQGNSLVPDPFSRAIDKELIATASVPAIRHHIEKQEEQAAKRSIKTANMLMNEALKLYRESAQGAMTYQRKKLLEPIERLQKKVLALKQNIGAEKVSLAIKENVDQAGVAVMEAEQSFAKLTANWDKLSFKEAKRESVETQQRYQVAYKLLNSMSTYVEQEGYLNSIYAIRARVRELRGAITAAQEQAQQHHAQQLARSDFNKAMRLNGQLGSMLVEADQNLKSKNYQTTKRKLENSIQVAEKTLVSFQNSLKRAKAAEAQQAALDEAEQGRLALQRKQQQLRQQQAKQSAQQQTQQAAQQASPQPQQAAILTPQQAPAEAKPAFVRPTRLRAKPSQRDVVAVENMLSDFKQAVERRDLKQLRQIADLSDSHLKILSDVFNQFNEVHMSVTSYSLSRTGATANIRFEKLVKPNGDNVLPAGNWRTGKLELVYSEDGWQKIRWY